MLYALLPPIRYRRDFGFGISASTTVTKSDRCSVPGKGNCNGHITVAYGMERLARESFVVEFIKEVRRKDPGIGGNKLWQMYRNRFGRAHSVGYNHFYDIIEKYGLKVRSVKRRVRTTDSSHGYPVYPDLTRSLIPDRPCQLVVSDVTYIPYWADPLTGEYQFCYLSLVTDYYTKEIVGYSVAPTLETKYPLRALEMALKHYEG